MKQGIGRVHNRGGFPFSLAVLPGPVARALQFQNYQYRSIFTKPLTQRYIIGPREQVGNLSALRECVLSTPERLAVALANSTSEFLIVLDEFGGVRYANPAFSRAVLGGQAAAGQNLYAGVFGWWG